MEIWRLKKSKKNLLHIYEKLFKLLYCGVFYEGIQDQRHQNEFPMIFIEFYTRVYIYIYKPCSIHLFFLVNIPPKFHIKIQHFIYIMTTGYTSLSILRIRVELTRMRIWPTRKKTRICHSKIRRNFSLMKLNLNFFRSKIKVNISKI